MLSRCFHFWVFEIFVSSLFLLVLFAFWECWYSALYNSEADSQEEDHDGGREPVSSSSRQPRHFLCSSVSLKAQAVWTAERNTIPIIHWFKGLQRPLEFMGIQGRYIYWAAATIGIAIVGFIIAYCLAGFVLALIVLAVTVTSGAGLILFKQRKGLHSKRQERGVFIYAYSNKM